MFVDDDEITNFLVDNMLSNAGYAGQQHFFSSARLALDYLASLDPSQAPQLIFLDIKMPEINGYDFLEKYHQEGYAQRFDTIIVMLTSSVNEEDRVRSQEYSSVGGFLSKPLKPEKINQIASQLIH